MDWILFVAREDGGPPPLLSDGPRQRLGAEQALRRPSIRRAILDADR
jgi:hypothetical protein